MAGGLHAILMSSVAFAGTGGSGGGDPDPGFSGTFTLATDGTIDTSEHGKGFGPGADVTAITIGFQSTINDLTFEVRGFDIDFSDEVQVRFKGSSGSFVSLGFMAGDGDDDGGTGPQNNAESTTRDSFTIAAADMVTSGWNEIEISQARDVNFTWGVTDFSLTEVIPLPAFTGDLTAIVDGATLTGEYGDFNGDSKVPSPTLDDKTAFTVGFEDPGTDVVLTFDGFDIDYESETHIRLNGTEVSQITGPYANEEWITCDSIVLPNNLMVSNDWNVIEFSQDEDAEGGGGEAGFKWGIRNIKLSSPVMDALADILDNNPPAALSSYAVPAAVNWSDVSAAAIPSHYHSSGDYIRITSEADIANKINGKTIQPGTHIRFDKLGSPYSDVTIDLNNQGTAANPIILLPSDKDNPPVFTSTVEFRDCDNTRVYAFEHDGEGLSNGGNGGIQIEGADNFKFLFCKLKQGGTSGIAMAMETGDLTNSEIAYLHGYGTGTDSNNSFMKIGGTGKDADVSNLVIRRSFFQNIDTHRETLSGKLGHVTIEDCHFDACRAVAARSAFFMEILRCRFTNSETQTQDDFRSNISINGGSCKVIDCVLDGNLVVSAGKQDSSQISGYNNGDDPPSYTGYPEAPSGQGSDFYHSAIETEVYNTTIGVEFRHSWNLFDEPEFNDEALHTKVGGNSKLPNAGVTAGRVVGATSAGWTSETPPSTTGSPPTYSATNDISNDVGPPRYRTLANPPADL